MKFSPVCFFVLCFMLTSSLRAQISITQIEGFLELAHQDDTTSVYVGYDAGQRTITQNEQGNVFMGFRAGMQNTSGTNNSFVGRSAGSSNLSGERNTFTGYFTGTQNISGDNNSFYGASSGFSNSIGNRNSFFGAFSGQRNQGENNSFFGAGAGSFSTSGSFNCFFGDDSGRVTKSSANSFFGSSSGRNNDTGSGNVFIGESSGSLNVTGNSNSFVGIASGLNATGSNNSFFGVLSGARITGDNNIAIGAQAGPEVGNEDVSNRLFIDNEETSEPLIYGELDNDLITINHSAANSGSGHLRGFRINNSNTGVYWNFYTFNSGTLGLYKTNDGNEKFQFRTNGDFVTDGAVNPSSDRNRKEAIIEIDPAMILDKLSQLPVTEWQYIGGEERHIGPMAQDFYAAFGLGLGEKTIATVDADGVALAAIKALVNENQQLENELSVLKDQNKEILLRLMQIEKILHNEKNANGN